MIKSFPIVEYLLSVIIKAKKTWNCEKTSLAAILREDIDIDSLDKYGICSRHFEGGNPADLYDTTNPAWLPTLHLGHEKRAAVARDDSMARYERATERKRKRNTLDDMLQ